MTELIWDGKYQDGKRVAPVRIALPFQTVESVNESAQVRAHQYDLWSQGRPTEWRNQLIWGDKKYVLPSLLPEFAGKVNLIYIDPPFATGADFSFIATVPETDGNFTKEPSMIEQKAYRDTWGRGLDSYLQWSYETFVLVHDLLAEDGTIYVHCDWRVNSVLKLALDDVFGADRFLNEIIWYYPNSGLKASSNKFHQVTDTILAYASSDTFTFHRLRRPRKDGQIKQAARKFNPLTKKADMVRDEYGNIVYLTIEDVLVNSLWEIPMLSQGPEKVGYPTQKPEALLERIINASSNEGDLVVALSQVLPLAVRGTCDAVAAA